MIKNIKGLLLAIPVADPIKKRSSKIEIINRYIFSSIDIHQGVDFIQDVLIQ